MRIRLIRKSIKNIWQVIVIGWLIFAYQLMLNMVPDEVNLIDGDLSKLDISMPVTFECRDSGQKFIDTSVIKNQQIQSNTDKGSTAGNKITEDNKIDIGSDTVILRAKLFGIIPIKDVQANIVAEQEVYASGENIGIYVQTDGVFVIGTGNFEGKDGVLYAPAQNVLKSGDYICAVDGVKLENKEALMDAVDKCEGKSLVLLIRRNGEELELYIQPKLSKEESYKLGVWVRDDLAGIGTLTYISPDGSYGALGHAVTDMDTGSVLEVGAGKLYNSKLVGIVKGEAGKPGELSGVINYEEKYCMGDIRTNCERGIYGTLHEKNNLLEHAMAYPVGYKQEIEVGDAEIISDIDGTIARYKIRITEVNYRDNKENKSILFEVEDTALLESTGGIVQGMSGSPIIQNGKLVGAVTHVFVNDAKKGYGIFIEDMLETGKTSNP